MLPFLKYNEDIKAYQALISFSFLVSFQLRLPNRFHDRNSLCISQDCLDQKGDILECHQVKRKSLLKILLCQQDSIRAFAENELLESSYTASSFGWTEKR